MADDQPPQLLPALRQPRLPNYAPGRHAPGLRIGTHNVLRFRGSLVDLVRDWWEDRLHVICVQETHLAPGTAPALEGRLRAASAQLLLPHAGFTCYWAHGTGNMAGQRGVGILIREDLLRSGALTVAAVPRPFAHPSGNLLLLPIAWRGHRLLLGNAYFPNDFAAQRRFIADTLSPALAEAGAAQRGVVLAGDFNHTLRPSLDRFVATQRDPAGAPQGWLPDAVAAAAAAHGGGPLAPPPPGRSAESNTAAAMVAACARLGLSDALRAHHPDARLFTFRKQGKASLLDRIYVSADTVLPHVTACSISCVPPSHSDHRPVLLHLVPLTPDPAPPPPGPRMPRLRCDFASDRSLSQEFQAWARAQEAAAPRDGAALLEWWPGFKRRLGVKLRDLQGRYRAQLSQAGAALPREAAAAVQRARQAAREALQRFEHAVSPVEASMCLQDVLQAERALHVATADSALRDDARARFTFLHHGERASRLVSDLMRPPSSSRQVAALRAPHGGGLVTSAPAMADAAVSFFSSVSAAPQCDPGARAQVLAAVRQHATRVATTAAEAAGRRAMDAGEVARAVSGLRPGSSPGPDGLPPGVWKLADRALAPLLCRLGSAIGACGRTPAGFLDGAVVVLHKSGDPTDLANYRPITLLNTDYRALARVLTARFTTMLHPVIGREQAACLPGRSIGDNILLMQLLPSLLALQHGNTLGLPDAGALVFLDIRKAFDTVCRTFLCDVLRAVGAEAVVPWVTTLLTATRAVAVVNRAVSNPAEWHAGVRQGCPLSPLLYLLVSWALSCWLRQQESVGLWVGARLCTCQQYMDDNVVPLRSATPQHVQALVSALDLFGQACGQHINRGKSAIMPIGYAQQVPPPGPMAGQSIMVCGLPLVAKATALGITFRATVDPALLPGGHGAPSESGPAPASSLLRPDDPTHAADWPALLLGVRRAFSKITRLGMSVFGRAIAGSAYGLSRVLYHAEFGGLPASVSTEISRTMAALADRGQLPAADEQPPAAPQPAAAGRGRRGRQAPAAAPAAAPPAAAGPPPRHRLPGLHSSLLPGHPSRGGFGLLPFEQHITARHALHGLRLLHHLASAGDDAARAAWPPWVEAAAGILSHSRVVGLLAPAVALLRLIVVTRSAAAGELDPSFDSLPGSLRRMLVAVRALGPVSPLGGASYDAILAALAPHAPAMPLWGNPLLTSRPPPAEPIAPHDQGYWWDAGVESTLAQLPGLRTLADLLALRARLRLWRDSRPDWSLRAYGVSDAYFDDVWRVRRALLSALEVRALVDQPHMLSLVLDSLWSSVPLPWRAAVEAAGHAPVVGGPAALMASPEAQTAAIRQLLRHLGWHVPGHDGRLSPHTRPILLFPAAAAAAAAPGVDDVAAPPPPFQLRVRDLIPILCASSSRIRNDRLHRFTRQAVYGVKWSDGPPAPADGPPRPALTDSPPPPPPAALAAPPPPPLYPALPDDLYVAAAAPVAEDPPPLPPAAALAAAEPAAAFLPPPAAAAVVAAQPAAPPPPPDPAAAAVPLAPLPPVPPPPLNLHDLPASQARLSMRLLPELWKLKWGNQHKEAWWRLACNGVSGAGGHDICLAGPCPCGWELPAACMANPPTRAAVGAPLMRQHTFWGCSVARAVVGALAEALPPAVRPRLLCTHIWLCVPPDPAVVNEHVWRVVCLAALSAMEYGRRMLWALHLSAARQPPAAAAPAGAAAGIQLTLFEAWGIDPPPAIAAAAAAANEEAGAAAAAAAASPLQRAARAAVADFWARLQDFVTLHAACEPKRWAGAALSAAPSLSAASGHPFMQIHPAGPAGQHRRLVLLVPGQQPPDADAAAAGVGGGGDDAG